MHRVLRFSSLTCPALALVLAGSSIALTSCGGSSRSETATRGLTDTRSDVGAGGKQVDDTLASLSTLVDRPQGDVHKAFTAFSGHVEELRALEKKIDAQTKDLAARNAVYFAGWDSDNAKIADQSLRATSAERRNDVQREFADLTNAYEDAKRSLQPFVANLTDIEHYLANDLTGTGIANVAPAATKAKDQGSTVKASLAAVQSRIDALSQSMGPARSH